MTVMTSCISGAYRTLTSVTETDCTDTCSLILVMGRVVHLSYHYMWPSLIYFDRFSEYVVETEIKN